MLGLVGSNCAWAQDQEGQELTQGDEQPQAEPSARAEQQPQDRTPEDEATREPTRRLFVDDKLVLNVYSEPAQAGERVATIETGDTVGELERADSFVRVRLGDGREGWVGANYLSAEPPAVVQLRDLQRERRSAAAAVEKKFTDELARLRKQNAVLEGEIKTLKASAPPAAAAPADSEPIEEEFEQESEPMPPQRSESSESGSAVWVALFAAITAGGAGFTAGYQTLARRIRRKFGGLRIY